MFRRIFLIALLVGFVAPAVLDVGEPAALAKKTKKKQKDKKHTRVKVCTEKTVTKGKKKKKRKSCEYVAQFSGHNAPKDTLRTEPLERPSGDVWVWSQNLHQEVKVNIYADASTGSFDEAALAQLDDVFRCRRSNEVRAVDPRLYEMLSRIQDHYEKAQVELVSGFRFKERSGSRHFHASAMDIKFKGVSIKDLYAYAQTLDLGGMGIGIYPNSGFVHVDFRAPGEPSYRWTDRSYPGSDGKASEARKPKPRKTKAKRPTS